MQARCGGSRRVGPWNGHLILCRRRRRPRAVMLPAIGALVLSTVATAWLLGGSTGFLYAALLALVGLPGIPLGFALFGRHHAAGWIAGLALGYAATTLA